LRFLPLGDLGRGLSSLGFQHQQAAARLFVTPFRLLVHLGLVPFAAGRGGLTYSGFRRRGASANFPGYWHGSLLLRQLSPQSQCFLAELADLGLQFLQTSQDFAFGRPALGGSGFFLHRGSLRLYSHSTTQDGASCNQGTG